MRTLCKNTLYSAIYKVAKSTFLYEETIDISYCLYRFYVSTSP